MKNTFRKYIVRFSQIGCLVAITFLVAFSTPILATAQADNQDQLWIQAVNIDKSAVNTDMNSLMAGVDPNSMSPQNLQKLIKNFQTYSTALMTDSQKAMDHSDSYTVSSDLKPTKDAYRNAMYQAKWVGFYTSQFSTDMSSNQWTKAIDDLKKLQSYINLYNTNINEMNRLYDIYQKTVTIKS